MSKLYRHVFRDVKFMFKSRIGSLFPLNLLSCLLSCFKSIAFNVNTLIANFFVWRIRFWRRCVYKSWLYLPGSNEVTWFVSFFFFFLFAFFLLKISRAYIYSKATLNKFINNYFSVFGLLKAPYSSKIDFFFLSKKSLINWNIVLIRW